MRVYRLRKRNVEYFMSVCQVRNFTIIILVTFFSFTGCSLTQKAGSDAVATMKDGLPQPSANNATLALLNRAIIQTESGKLEAAAASIERALRIEPKNPQLWHRLAVIRFKQGQFNSAINLAAKSNTLIVDDKALSTRNREIINQAKRR